MRIGHALASVNSLIFLSSVIFGRPISQPSLRHAREVSAIQASKSDSLAELAPAAVVTLADGIPGVGENRENTDPENAVDSVCIYVVETGSGVEPLAAFCRGSEATPLLPSSSSSPSSGGTEAPTESPGNRFAQTRSLLTSSGFPSSSSTGTDDADQPVITSREPASVRVATTTSRRCGSKPFPPYGLRPEVSSASSPIRPGTQPTSETSPSTPAAFFTIPTPVIPLSPTDDRTTTDNLQETVTETVTIPSPTPISTAGPSSSPSPPQPSSNHPVNTPPSRQTITPSDITTAQPTTSTAPSPSSSASDSIGGINIVPVAK